MRRLFVPKVHIGRSLADRLGMSEKAPDRASRNAKGRSSDEDRMTDPRTLAPLATSLKTAFVDLGVFPQSMERHLAR